jgi:hypothetical protein
MLDDEKYIKLIICCNLYNAEFHDIITKFLYDCKLNACGYNTSREEYWGEYKNRFNFIIKLNNYKIFIYGEIANSKHILTISKKLKLYIQHNTYIKNKHNV